MDLEIMNNDPEGANFNAEILRGPKMKYEIRPSEQTEMTIVLLKYDISLTELSLMQQKLL